MTLLLHTDEPFTRNPFAADRTDMLNEMAAWIRKYAELEDAIEEPLLRSRPENLGSSARELVNAVVVSSNALLGVPAYRWTYTLKRITFDNSNQGYVAEDDPFTTDALNIREMNHTQQYSWGVDTFGPVYPGVPLNLQFTPKPIGGAGTNLGHVYDVPVTAWSEDVFGITRWYFEAMGSHDGDCPAQP